MNSYYILPTFLFTASVQAASLVHYDFEGFAAGTAVTSAYATTFAKGSYVSSVDIQASSSYVTVGDGITNPWDGNLVRGSIRRNPAGAGIYIVDDAAAVQRDAYFSFTYTPTAETSLTTINLQAAVGAGDTVNIVLRSSLTGLTVNDAIDDILITAQVNLGERQQLSFDLSGVAEFQDMTDPVTFYFYTNTSGDTGTSFFYLDDLTLEGTTIPEPSSLGLLAIAGSAFLTRRRVRRL